VTTMTDILDDLEAKAEAADAECAGEPWRLAGKLTIRAGRDRWVGKMMWWAVKCAEFIAAANPAAIKSIISRCRKAEAEVERLGNNIIGLEACEKIYQHDVEVHLLKPRDEEIARLKADVARLTANSITLEQCADQYRVDSEMEIARLKAEIDRVEDARRRDACAVVASEGQWIDRVGEMQETIDRLRGLLAEASESMRMSLSEFDYRKTQSASFSDPRWVDAARSISAKIEETLK